MANKINLKNGVSAIAIIAVIFVVGQLAITWTERGDREVTGSIFNSEKESILAIKPEDKEYTHSFSLSIYAKNDSISSIDINLTDFYRDGSDERISITEKEILDKISMSIKALYGDKSYELCNINGDYRFTQYDSNTNNYSVELRCLKGIKSVLIYINIEPSIDKEVTYDIELFDNSPEVEKAIDAIANLLDDNISSSTNDNSHSNSSSNSNNYIQGDKDNFLNAYRQYYICFYNNDEKADYWLQQVNNFIVSDKETAKKWLEEEAANTGGFTVIDVNGEEHYIEYSILINNQTLS